MSLKHLLPEDIPKVKEELDVIRQLKHDNLISWMDHWYKPDAKSMVFITELMPEGSLRQYLQKIGTPRTKVIRQWARQILSGLTYLHSQSPPIVHGYLKPDNLYVIPNTGVVKIGGLGKSIIFHHSASRSSISARFEYMAPELLRDKKVEGADVYSLGMCLLEICIGAPPFEECKTPAAIFHRIISGRKPLSLSRIINEGIAEFIDACIKPLPERPSVAQLVQSEFLTASPENASQAILLKPKSDVPILEGRQIEIEMMVPCMGGNHSQKISFSFNLEKDTPDAVAAEMVQDLGLARDQNLILSRLISERLYQFFHPMIVECPTPSTRRESVSESVELEDEEFLRERRLSKLRLIEDDPQALHGSECWPSLSSRSLHILETSAGLQMHTAVLKVGGDNNEEEVKVLQALLSEKYGFGLQATGVFGKKTETLVKHFQEEVGEEVTGIVTPNLLVALIESVTLKEEPQCEVEHPATYPSLI